jgi:acetyl/propionyl-CoA carboxylase alpha subunit
MEMNTRLQVERSTEMITGLVSMIAAAVAAGEKLPLTQAQVSVSGHAIRHVVRGGSAQAFCRRPASYGSSGAADHIRWIRASCGAESQSYDAMIAKVIGWGENRDAAIETLRERSKKLSIRSRPARASSVGLSSEFF